VLIGRSAGLTDEKLASLGDDPLPEGVYEPSEEAVVRYARASARNDRITAELYNELAHHFPVETMIQICFVVGLAGLTNRFHSSFLTEVDPATQDALEASCPIYIPQPPEG
jgi:alkylhydroperoxidase family enzyme